MHKQIRFCFPLLILLALISSLSSTHAMLPQSAMSTRTQAQEWTVLSSPTTSYLNAVAIVSIADGWAVGDGGTLLRWNGREWTTVTSPTANRLNSVAMVSATDGWAVGNGGTLLHWDGSEWKEGTNPTTNDLYSVAMSSATDGWAVGAQATLHWNGSAWMAVPNPLSSTEFERLNSVAIVSSADAWAVGAGFDSASGIYSIIMHWDGGEWTKVPSPTTQPLNSVAMVSAADGWAVGNRITRWDGTDWTVIPTTPPNTLNAVAMISTTDGWAVGAQGTIMKWDGDGWTFAGVISPTNTLNAVAMVSTANSWAVGENGSIAHYGSARPVSYVYLPAAFRNARPKACEETLTKMQIWQGGLNWRCDSAVKRVGAESLKLQVDTFSIVELYSPLIAVKPNQLYEISYWVKTNLEIRGADLYGRVVAAQYNAQAKESDAVNENRLDAGFTLGESVGGQTDWTYKSYTFTTGPEAAYARLRALVGGPIGTARGEAWFDQVTIHETDRRLTDPSSNDYEPVLSPDSQTVVFASDWEGQSDIFSLPITGGQAINLTQTPYAEDTPVFSLDGETILFASDRSGDWDIYSMDTDGSNVQLSVSHFGTDELHPSFAPDGQTIAFSSNLVGGNWDIYTTSVPSGTLSLNWTRLTTHPARDRFPSLSADGEHIVFRSERDGNSEVYIMKADGGNLRRLTADLVYDGYPSLTPDGSGVVFTSNRSGQWNTNVANLAGGGVMALEAWPYQHMHTPRLSPDGKRLVYAGGNVNGNGNYDIYLREVFTSPLLAVGHQGFASLQGNCDWEGGVLALGWGHAWQATGDEQYLKWTQEWIDGCVPTNKISDHVNDGLLGYAALVAYEGYNQSHYLNFAQSVADYLLNTADRTADGTLMHAPGIVWVDTLVGTVPFLLEMSRVTGDSLYFEEALTQTVKLAGHLQDVDTGLYYHARWESTDQLVGRVSWGRGNGWAMLANVELLSAMPVTHPMSATVLSILQNQAAGLEPLQDANGLWPTVVTRPYFYLETSASALIGYGFKRGVEAGWLSPDKYATTVDAAIVGVWRRVLADGSVTGVSAPTGPATTEGAYNAIPYDKLQLYGQGAILMMTSSGINSTLSLPTAAGLADRVPSPLAPALHLPVSASRSRDSLAR